MALVSFLDKTDKQGQLMLAFAKGNAKAFETLYSHFKAPLYRFFLRQCGSQPLAEELYQELWMRVIKARENYKHTAKFSTWLYRIAHNLLIDHFRKAELDADEIDDDSLADTSFNNPEHIIASQEKIVRFLTLLHNLPDEQREVFLLKEEVGLSLEEVAKITETSFETTKSRLRYAIKKLKQSLEDAA